MGMPDFLEPHTLKTEDLRAFLWMKNEIETKLCTAWEKQD